MPPGPAATGKWLTASVTDDIPGVIAAGFDEAGRRDPHRQRTWIALVDGNKQQIEAIEAEAAGRGVTVRIVCDFIHVLEYTWKAAWSVFEPADPAAEEWVAIQATKILQGKSAKVAAGIRRRATTFGYSAAERKGADEAAGYLTAEQPYLDYPSALQRGWPIATGVIESACRHPVKDMDITGHARNSTKPPSTSAPGSATATSTPPGPSTCGKNSSPSTTTTTETITNSPPDQLTPEEPHPKLNLIRHPIHVRFRIVARPHNESLSEYRSP